MGAMSMGLAFAGRETFYFDQLGRVLNPQLRTYRPLRYGENPEYLVDFVYTPDLQAAYGARGVGEHGLLGMPGALGNALSVAAGVSLHHLPLTPELIWRTKEGKVMLQFEFDYYQPGTWKEAVELYQSENQKGKKPMFISGGTELITLGRIDLGLY